MTIQPNEEGWSFSGELQENQLCFVHKDNTRIFYGKSNISTTDTLFVGTEDECQAEMQRLKIPFIYRLVTNNSDIVFFGPKIDSDVYNGNEFLGTKEECEAEIDRLSAEASNNVLYNLIYDENLVILFFGSESENTEVRGIKFLGSKQECEIEIMRLNLSYTKPELPQEEIQTEPANVDNEVIYSEDTSEADFVTEEIKLDSFE